MTPDERWEAGIDHHPESVQLIKAMGSVDVGGRLTHCYPNMCRDGHDEVGHHERADGDERCPVCVVLAERDEARQWAKNLRDEYEQHIGESERIRLLMGQQADAEWPGEFPWERPTEEANDDSLFAL